MSAAAQLSTPSGPGAALDHAMTALRQCAALFAAVTSATHDGCGDVLALADIGESLGVRGADAADRARTTVGSIATATYSDEIPRLQSQVRLIDDLAGEGFGAIEAIARLVLIGIESREKEVDTATLTTALVTIVSTAQRIRGLVSFEAEQAGSLGGNSRGSGDESALIDPLTLGGGNA